MVYKFISENISTLTSLLIALTGLVGSVLGAKKWIKSQQNSDRSSAWAENVELRKEMRAENLELKSGSKELHAIIERLEGEVAALNVKNAEMWAMKEKGLTNREAYKSTHGTYPIE